MTAQTPFAYFGGKQRVADRIAEMLPPHMQYVEPFGGGLSVLMAKRPAKMETVNDLDGDIQTFWRVLRDRPDDLARACALTPHSRAEYALASNADLDAVDDLERARLVWVQISQGRAGQLVRTGWRNFVKPAAHLGIPAYLDAYVDRMAGAAERLHRVSIECRPALDVIADYGANRETLIYVDPPYLGETRGQAHSYRHEMRAAEQHVELADALHNAAATVVLSGYHSPLYDRLFGDWQATDIKAYTTPGAPTEDRTKGHRTEVIWSNRPLNTHPTLNYEGALTP